jgi:hypothetical protein
MSDVSRCSHIGCVKKAVIQFDFPDHRFTTTCQEHALEASEESWKAGALNWRLVRSIKRPLRILCPDCKKPVLVDPKTKVVTHEDAH